MPRQSDIAARRQPAEEPGRLFEGAAFGFAEFCADATRPVDDVIAEFHRIVSVVGFTSAVAVGDVWQARRPPRFLFNTLPADWMELIAREDLMRRGLSANVEMYRRMAPFEALSAARARGMTPLEREGYDIQVGYGWRTIFAVPIHGPATYHGAVIVTSKESIAITPRLSAALRLLALSVHDRCHGDSRLGLPDGDPGLSWRELECLQYVAAGLSDKEIARRVGISDLTVKDHIARGRSKLKARSRAAAAAVVMLMGKAVVTEHDLAAERRMRAPPPKAR